MIDERDEFLISQLADGSIDPADRDRAQALVDGSPEARDLLASYQALDHHLHAARDLPVLPALAIDTAKLARRISAAIDADEAAERRRHRIGWIGRAGGGLAVAASLALAVGVWINATRQAGIAEPVAPHALTDASPAGLPVVVAINNLPAPAAGAIAVTITGPRHSVLVQEELVLRPSVLLVAKQQGEAQDTGFVAH